LTKEKEEAVGKASEGLKKKTNKIKSKRTIKERNSNEQRVDERTKEQEDERSNGL